MTFEICAKVWQKKMYNSQHLRFMEKQSNGIVEQTAVHTICKNGENRSETGFWCRFKVETQVLEIIEVEVIDNE